MTMVKWLIDNRVLSVNFPEDMDNIDFMRCDEHIVNHLSKANGSQVHLIFNNYHLQRIPRRTVYQYAHFPYHEKLGWGLTVGNNELGRFFTLNFMELHEVYFHMCQSVSECFEFLNIIEPELGLSTDLHSILRTLALHQ